RRADRRRQRDQRNGDETEAAAGECEDEVDDGEEREGAAAPRQTPDQDRAHAHGQREQEDVVALRAPDRTELDDRAQPRIAAEEAEPLQHLRQRREREKRTEDQAERAPAEEQ